MHETNREWEWAANDYAAAASHYEKLADTRRAARARWNELQSRDRRKKGIIPEDLAELLKTERDPAVCVEAVTLHTKQIASRSGGRAIAKRRGTSAHTSWR